MKQPGAHFPLPGWTEALQPAALPLLEGHFCAPASPHYPHPPPHRSAWIKKKTKKTSFTFFFYLLLPPRDFTPNTFFLSWRRAEFFAHGSATLRLLSGWDLAAVSGARWSCDGVKARQTNPQFLTQEFHM